jgi:hypothetical protein
MGFGLAIWLGAGTATASPDTLRMAIEDIVMGAADVAVSPVTGGIATSRNLEQVSDSGILQGLYAVPGWLGLTALQAVQGALRMAVGVVELFPGIALFAFEPDLDPDLNVFRRGELLLDIRNPLGQKPPWLAYIPVATPFTIDARIGPISPWALYRESQDDRAGSSSDAPGD